MNFDKIDNFFSKRQPKWAYFVLPIGIFSFVLIETFFVKNSQQFSDLANSFLHLKLYFLKPIGNITQNPVYYKGREYFDNGPLPAIILMPFVYLFNLFHDYFYQGYLQWILDILTLFIVNKIARKIGFNHRDSWILAFGFSIGSVFLGVAVNSSSWYFAQVLTTLLVFLIIDEYLNNQNWFVLGFLSGLVALTRLSAWLAISTFLGLFLLEQLINHKNSLKNIIKFMVPILISGIIIGLYNFLRFGNIFNGGYYYQAIDLTAQYSRSKGLFSIDHIPFNLYHLLLGTPLLKTIGSSWQTKFPYIINNPLGLSIFITSPYFIYLIYKGKLIIQNKTTLYLLISSLVGLIVILLYFGVGTYQFGYRYSLDFLPELFTVFMMIYYKQQTGLSNGMKALFLINMTINFYLLLSFL